MNQSKKITDGALLTAVYIVLLLLAMFIPFVILFGIFILPIPFIIYAARYDWKPTLLMVIASLLVSFIIATVISLPLTILAGFGGIMVGVAIHRNLSAYETWARGTVGFVIGLLMIVMFMQFVLNINFAQEMEVMVEESMGFAERIMQQTGVLSIGTDELELIEEQMGMFIDLLPSSIVIMSIILAFLSQWISYRVINRLDKKKLSFPPFRKLNFPTAVIWIYFIVLMLSFIDLDKNNSLYIIIINAVSLLIVLLTIQGFSFIFFYTHFKNIGKVFPIIIVISSLIFPILLFIIRIIGLVDIGFSLKERVAKRKK